MAYKTSVYLIQYFFYFAPILNFKLKTVQDTMLGKLYLANTYKGLITLVTRRTIASFEFKVSWLLLTVSRYQY
jgi:hypothetical protein